MPQAPAYNRAKNFLENNPDRTDHAAMNAELDKVALSDSAFIPSDPANTDWQQYQQWLEAGNAKQLAAVV